MEATLKPSAAADFTPAYEVVELPVPQRGGEPFLIGMSAPPYEGVLKVQKGILPAATPEKADEGEAEELSDEDQIERTERILGELGTKMRGFLEEGGATDPPLSFDEPREGAIPWRSLHPRNRAFLVAAMERLSGLGPTRVDRLGSFRDERGRAAPGPTGDGSLPAGEDAAPGGGAP